VNAVNLTPRPIPLVPYDSKSTSEIMSCKTKCCLNEIHSGMKGSEAHVKSNFESLKVLAKKSAILRKKYQNFETIYMTKIKV